MKPYTYRYVNKLQGIERNNSLKHGSGNKELNGRIFYTFSYCSQHNFNKYPVFVMVANKDMGLQVHDH